MKKVNFQVAKVQPQVLLAPGVAVVLLVFFANFSLTLPIKVLLIKKACVLGSHQADSDASY